MSGENEDLPARPPLERASLLALTGAKLLVHLLLANRYGYFRDELYFLDCGRHLDWGYVDHAPLIGLVAKAALLLGGSLPALRFFPAVAGAAVVALTILLAREIGGGRYAPSLAGLAVLIVPIYLGIDSILSMNAFEPLFWMGAVYVLARILRTGNSRLWIAFGALVGLGLENKHSTIFFGFAAAVAVLATPLRRELRKPWIYLGAAAALLLFLPNLVWQAQHGFPTLEDLRNVREMGKNVVLDPISFLVQQILMMHPILFPVWILGLRFFLMGGGKTYRALGWIYLALLAVFLALHGKFYYLAPAYPMLLAGGAVAIEEWLEGWVATRGRLWPKAAVAGVIAAAGILFAPMMLPILPPERYVAYQKALEMQPGKTEVEHVGPLPQLFGDQFGWPEMVEEVARIYDALPAEERAKACIFAGNYGEAGAVNLFGPRHGLPAAISGHQTHFFWGPRGCTGEVLIVLQRSREGLERVCASVEEAGRHEHPWGMAEENGPIHVCRGLKTPLSEMWPRVKHWN